MPLDWEDLKYADALAAAGTYAAAGKALGVNATTVARRIAHLAAGFPYALFAAVEGRWVPTTQCVQMLAHVREIHGHVDAIARIPAAAAGVTGHVRVAATPAVCDDILAPAASALLAAHGGLQLTLLASDRNVDFPHFKADMAVRLAKPERGGFLIRRLGALKLKQYGPAEPGEAALVCAYPPYLESTPESRELARLGLSGKARFFSNSARALAAVIAAGNATAILPELAPAATLPGVAAQELETRREAWLLVQPHLRKDAAAQAVRDWIVDCFAPFRKAGQDRNS